jgi:hypothetical protein
VHRADLGTTERVGVPGLGAVRSGAEVKNDIGQNVQHPNEESRVTCKKFLLLGQQPLTGVEAPQTGPKFGQNTQHRPRVEADIFLDRLFLRPGRDAVGPAQ